MIPLPKVKVPEHLDLIDLQAVPEWIRPISKKIRDCLREWPAARVWNQSPCRTIWLLRAYKC